mmetsp:Transcript_43354/g.99905  ORF Transcript_43354/g.99905 Transcript_43354/m.99905 type:complete len:541 (-) Transcript_43354:142-1764(-)
MTGAPLRKHPKPPDLVHREGTVAPLVPSATASHTKVSTRKPSTNVTAMVSKTAPPPHILALLLAWFTVAAPRLIPTSLVLVGLVRRWKQHRRSILAITCTWVACYLHSVRRVRLRIGGSAPQGSPPSSSTRRLAHIVRLCPSLTGMYWPTWCAPFSTLQVALLLCKEVRGRFLQRSCYQREVLQLQDGVCVALDWVAPSGEFANEVSSKSTHYPFGLSKAILPADADYGLDLAPVCVLLHGAFMDSSSTTMSDLARSLAAKGFPVVVMGRRGYGGFSIQSATDPMHIPKVSFYGFDEDLECALDVVAKRYPRRPIALVGFSCGSGFATRFTGNRRVPSAWEMDEENDKPSMQKSRLLCVVAYDGAYDASPAGGPVALLRWPYTWIVNLSVKFFYVLRHYEVLIKAGYSETAHSILNPCLGLVETYQETLTLSGQKTVEEFLQVHQPKLSGINVPSLLVNSRDDPICVWENVEHSFNDILDNPNIAHADMFCGTHGCKFGFLGFSSYMEAMVGEFVAASWHEWQAVHRSSKDYIAESAQGA